MEDVHKDSLKKLVYTCNEAAEALSLSKATVARLCREGRLPRIQGIRHILIPTALVEQWIQDNTVYNPGCDKATMGGEHSWIIAKRKKVSTSQAISGMPLTQMQAVKELDALLDVRSHRSLRRSS